jgi:hypothetical protein
MYDYLKKINHFFMYIILKDWVRLSQRIKEYEKVKVKEN